MSPYVIIVVLILAFLFVLLSLVPVLNSLWETDPFDQYSENHTKASS